MPFNSLVETNIGKEFNSLIWVYLVYSVSGTIPQDRFPG